MNTTLLFCYSPAVTDSAACSGANHARGCVKTAESIFVTVNALTSLRPLNPLSRLLPELVVKLVQTRPFFEKDIVSLSR